MSISGDETKAYSVDLREKAISLIEKGKSKAEVVELLEIGMATVVKKESSWLKPAKNGNFIQILKCSRSTLKN